MGKAAFAAALALAACGSEEPTQGSEKQAIANDVVPIGGPGRPQTLAEATQGQSQVAMWKVGDEDTTVYLVGTVHLMQPGVRWQTPQIMAAFDIADAVYLEADVLSREAQRAMGVVVKQTAPNPDSFKLSTYYDATQKTRINAVLEGISMNLGQLDEYRPWFAAMQVSVLAMIEAGGDPAYGAEIVISREMIEQGTELRYLETAAQQIGILAQGDDTRDAAHFLDLLDTLEEGEAYFSDLMAAWYQGDEERMEFLVNGAMKSYPQMRQRLLTDRNLDWSQQLDRLMTDEPGTFVVAVGAGHLVGEHSVQSKLSDRGYDSERL
ncbi:MAG: TraB/GumN family protein [Pseudomonadota bacterium]